MKEIAVGSGPWFMLGLMYGVGVGVPKNYTEAVKWYRTDISQVFGVNDIFRLILEIPGCKNSRRKSYLSNKAYSMVQEK